MYLTPDFINVNQYEITKKGAPAFNWRLITNGDSNDCAIHAFCNDAEQYIDAATGRINERTDIIIKALEEKLSEI